MKSAKNVEVATLAGGCFWCLEAVFQRVKGVNKVVSGYSGGSIAKPTYEQVCSGNSGHAEAVQIYFNPKEVSYEQLLSIFWEIHDPTTLNQQGNDIGSQYRSAIFYVNDEQLLIAQKSKAKQSASKRYAHPIVTKIEAMGSFYPAEKYHQDYYNSNPTQSYCRIVIDRKIKKMKQKISSQTKED